MIAAWQDLHLIRKIRISIFVAVLAVCQMAATSRIVSAQLAEASFVRFAWSGAVTSNSAVVKAKLDKPGSSEHLAVSEAADFSQPVYVAPSKPGANILSFVLSGLKPDTTYYYVVESNGKRDTSKSGRLRTFPSGPASFQIAFGSCAWTGSDHPVFDTIRGLSPLFFLHMGDFHYEDIKNNDPAKFRWAYEAVFASTPQARLYREIPIAYIWDDHDFGGNNSDSTAASRPAARATYQEYVPHYPLAAGCCDVPIYQSFEAGRVYFILTDERSERTPATKPDNSGKTVLGAAQKDWLKSELLKGAKYPLVVWVGTAPWIEAKTSGSDRWGGYSTERQELANFIKKNKIDNLIMLSGDAHMVALDDGTNSGYAQGGGGDFPVLHAASLDQRGSKKGGPYSHGTFPNVTSDSKGYHGQFGVLTVTDTGGSEVCIEFRGRRQVFRTSEVVDLLKVPWKKCFPASGVPPS
jgi:phosphodiesterase/alkaline phosphatase D-like protein